MSSKENFYFTLQGYHEEVTGSCIVCTIHFPNNSERKFLVDFGMFQESEYEHLNSEINFNQNDIDAVLVTHSHLDHIGRLPYLVKNGYNGPIYSSYLTKLISTSILRNSAKIFQSNFEKEKRITRNPDLPLFSNEDVEDTLMLFETFKYNEKVDIDENISVTFLDNGHILSASMILLEAKYKNRDPIYILFTGDYKSKNTFKEVISLPEYILKLPLNIVCESTLCEEENISYEASFKSRVISCLDSKKGVLIPCLAQERFEEVLYELKKIQELGYSFEICVDAPLAEEIHKIYSRYSCTDYMPSNVIFVTSREEREIVFRSPKPRILLVSSGMCDFGNAPLYLNNFLDRSDYEVLFTSFLAKNTLGNQIMKLKRFKRIRIPGHPQSVKKMVITHQTREFTSHAKTEELIEFITQFENIKHVFINHGSSIAQETLKQKLNDLYIDSIILGTRKFHKVTSEDSVLTFDILDEEEEEEKKKSQNPSKGPTPNRTVPIFLRGGYSLNSKAI